MSLQSVILPQVTDTPKPLSSLSLGVIVQRLVGHYKYNASTVFETALGDERAVKIRLVTRRLITYTSALKDSSSFE